MCPAMGGMHDRRPRLDSDERIGQAVMLAADAVMKINGNWGGLDTAPLPSHGHQASLNLTLPPLGVVFFKYQGRR